MYKQCEKTLPTNVLTAKMQVQDAYCKVISFLKKLYVYGCFAYMCVRVPHAYMQCLHRPEKGVGFPGTAVMDGYVLQCRCLELNPRPLEEQSVLVTAEPSLYAVLHNFFNSVLEITSMPMKSNWQSKTAVNHTILLHSKRE